MVVTVTLNPSVDHTLFIDGFRPNDANRVRRVERDAGGKGLNLSRVHAELGGVTTAIGILPHGGCTLVHQVLDEQGVEHDFVDIPGNLRVNISVEDGSGKPPTTFNEPGATVPPDSWIDLVSRLRRHAVGADWIAAGGSIPPGLPPSVYADLVDIAHELGVAVLIDGDGESMRLAAARVPDMIKPNEDEAARLLGWTSAQVRDDPIAALAAMRSSARIVVLTLGAAGAWLATEGETWQATPPKVEVRSTIGSGDSLLAGLLFARSKGEGWDEALRLGVACGAATATTDGSEIARRPIIEGLKPQVRVERVTMPT